MFYAFGLSNGVYRVTDAWEFVMCIRKLSGSLAVVPYRGTGNATEAFLAR